MNSWSEKFAGRKITETGKTVLREDLRVLVTGGAGFVGRHLTERLVKDGYEVTITTTGSEVLIPGVHKVLYTSLEGIDWRCVYGQDMVVHLMANNDTRCHDQNEMYRANVFGPIKLFQSALDGGCQKFVYASSTAIYGNSPAPYDEDTTEIKPLNVYAQSKADFEKFAASFAKDHKVSVTGLRYCNVYGPGEDRKDRRMSMIGQLLRNLVTKTQPVLFKDGEQRRDWVYVKDVTEANVAAMIRSSRVSPHVVYNVGSGTSVTFNELVRVINELAPEGYGLNPNFIDCPFPEAYQNHTECKIERAQTGLGYFPKYDIRSGIADYLQSLISASS